MAGERTTSARLTFGKHRGKKVSELPDGYLEFMVKNMWNGDLHDWAFLAKQVLQQREESGDNAKDAESEDLEVAADRILKKAGFSKLVPRQRR